MIASISERNRSRRVVFPFCCHANPVNVCCLATLASVQSALTEYHRQPRFPQHRQIWELVQSFPRGNTMARTEDPDFVVKCKHRGYVVQPPIVHPPFCVCKQCKARRPEHLWGEEFTIRARRNSPYKTSRTNVSSVRAEVEI